MANNNGNSGVTVVVLVAVALAGAALLVHLHHITEWSHGASQTAAIARYGFDTGRPGP
jgi:hypothetical protein